MRRAFLVVAASVGFATVASAATLTVSTETLSNVPQNVFDVGETFILKVIGDAQGGEATGIYGDLAYDGAITTTVAASQSPMYSTPGAQYLGDGFGTAFNQAGGIISPIPPSNQILTSTLTLIADATGSSLVSWTNYAGSGLYFFDISVPDPSTLPPAHSFTIVPEPATAALIGLGLLGLALRFRRSPG